MMKTSIKLKFRPSVKPEKEGTLYYQLIHERRVKHIKTHYKIKSNEWDELSEAIVVPTNDSQRKHQVESVERCIKWDIQRLEKIVEEYEDKGLPYGLNHIADAYQKLCQKHSLFSFMEDVIVQYQRHGQTRTSET